MLQENKRKLPKPALPLIVSDLLAILVCALLWLMPLDPDQAFGEAMSHIKPRLPWCMAILAVQAWVWYQFCDRLFGIEARSKNL